MRYDPDLARQGRTVRHIEPMLTTHQRAYNDNLKIALTLPEGQATGSVSNGDDGTRQFILGVDSLDDEDVTIGIAE